jgi:arylsulfatase A-like enzyme
MKRAIVIVCAMLAGIASSGIFVAAAEEQNRPNILVIVTDNQPGWAMGCAGNRIISTPNLDQLAIDGVRFRNAFVSTPICAASRASLFTGLYRRRHGFTFNTEPLQESFVTASYPAILKGAGYQTALIGKFGIESNGKLMVENEARSLEMMFNHFDNFEHWGKSGPKGYFVVQPDGGKQHLTDVTSDKAVSFLKKHAERRRKEPFCLTLCFNAPHAQDDDPKQYFWPARFDAFYREAIIPKPVHSDPGFFEALPDFLRTSLGRERWHWRFDTPEKFQSMMKGMYRMVSGIDDAVGRVRVQLKQLGFAENTLIIFTSDNGMFFGERGLSDCWLLNEESIRVPFILFDPLRRKKTQRKSVRDEMVLNIDIAPTILQFAGLDAARKMDGRGLGPLLDEVLTPWRDDFLCEHLFVHGKIPKSEGIRSKTWKYIRYFEQKPIYEELYDLMADPHEAKNLAGSPQYAGDLETLRRRCDELIAEATQ